MRPRPSGASTGPREAQKGRIKMKIPEHYIEELNEIIENEERYNNSELFYAYKNLYELKDAFRFYGQSPESDEYGRLLGALVRIELNIALKLFKVDELERRG